MKSEPKPFASLSSGLLARKGGARPAMRPQGFGQIGGNLEDLGWNDMGFEAPKPAEAPRDSEHDAFGEPIAEHPALHGHAGLTPVNSPVHSQQAEIEDRFNEPEDATDEGEEVDDTAEIVEEFDELPVQPVEARAPMYVVPSASKSARGSGQQGEGCIYTPARSGASSEAASGLCPQRALGSASRHRRSRSVPRWNA